MEHPRVRRFFMPLTGGVIVLLVASFLYAQALLPENPSKGARLFVNKGCVRCHALKGEGGRTGPDLGKIDVGDTQLESASKLLNHIPPMASGMERMKMVKPTLTPEDLVEISGYIYFLRFFDEPGNGVRGRYLFNEKGCSRCHPETGKGKEGEVGLDHFPQNVTPVYLSQMIWNHGSLMMAQISKLGMKWPVFEGTEMMDLLDYIRMNAKGARENALITPGNPQEGRKIFAEKGCTKCHSIRGVGGKGGEDLGKRAKVLYTSLTQIASLMWNKGPTVLSKMAQTQIGIPKFTTKEMADLIAYLYFLHFIDDPGNPGNGKEVFVRLGCVKCHNLDGRPGEIMNIDLSKYEKSSNPMDVVAGIWNHSGAIEKAMREKDIAWPVFKKRELADLLEYLHSAKN